MCHGGEVHDFLHVALAQHGETGLAAGHDVGVIAEDVQRVGRQQYGRRRGTRRGAAQLRFCTCSGSSAAGPERPCRWWSEHRQPREPCTAPAAPASDCISTTLTWLPKMFFRPFADHWSTRSAIGAGRRDGINCRNFTETHSLREPQHYCRPWISFFLP